jgi:hypothetical protein
MKNKPALLLIGEVSPITSEIAEILRSDFTVRLLSPDEPSCNDIKHFTYCVCAVNFDKIDSAIFRKIQSNVIDKSGILLIT